MKRQYLIYLMTLITSGVVLVVLFIGGPALILAQGPSDDLTGLAAFGPAFTYLSSAAQRASTIKVVAWPMLEPAN